MFGIRFAFVIGTNVAIVVPADSILGTATRDMGAMRLNRYGGEGPKAYMLKTLLSKFFVEMDTLKNYLI